MSLVKTWRREDLWESAAVTCQTNFKQYTMLYHPGSQNEFQYQAAMSNSHYLTPTFIFKTGWEKLLFELERGSDKLLGHYRVLFTAVVMTTDCSFVQELFAFGTPTRTDWRAHWTMGWNGCGLWACWKDQTTLPLDMMRGGYWSR